MERFWSKVAVDPALSPSKCWLWTGAKTPKGYGSFGVGGDTVYAHRFAYEWAYGPIPPGWMICHWCDTPNCVNPSHLFPGKAKDNTADMIAKGRARSGQSLKTHCPKGHPYDEANTYHYRGKRGCRACRNLASAR